MISDPFGTHVRFARAPDLEAWGLGRNRSPPPRRRPNQTSNQTSGGSLVSHPRLPAFASFPFRFPSRGVKGSGPEGAAGSHAKGRPPH